jgi:hypothetical protein
MIVAIYLDGTGQIPVEEFREATSAAEAVDRYEADYSPPRIGYAGLACVGWVDRQDPGPGNTWSVDADAAPRVLIATPLAEDLEFVASSSMADATINQSTVWQDLDGLVTAASGLTARWADARGRVIGQIATTGAGVELRVVKGDAATPMHATPYAPGDTAGAWVTFAFATEDPPDPSLTTYRLQGRLNGAASAAIQYCNLSLSVPRG